MVSLNIGRTATDVLAARRLTRLIVQDEITEPLRENKFVEKHEKLAYLLNCPYCVSVYTSGFIALCSTVFPRGTKILRYGLALAEIQASLKDIESQMGALVDNTDYGPPL